MIHEFNEFNSKFKFLFNLDTDTDVAKHLGIALTTFASMKRSNQIPYEKVIAYCKERCVDLNWIININKK